MVASTAADVWQFKPCLYAIFCLRPPPFGGAEGIVFVLSVRACARPSVMFVVYGMCWSIFIRLLSVVHLGTKMNFLGFGVKGSQHNHICWNTILGFISLISPVLIDALEDFNQMRYINLRFTYLLTYGVSPNVCRCWGQKVKVTAGGDIQSWSSNRLVS